MFVVRLAGEHLGEVVRKVGGGGDVVQPVLLGCDLLPDEAVPLLVLAPFITHDCARKVAAVLVVVINDHRI